MALVLTAAVTGAMAAPELLSVRVDDPRAYGHSVGDVVTRHATIEVPDGLTLDPNSLPQPGQRGRALELRKVNLEPHGHTLDLRLEYQVFLAPRDVRVLEMPPVMLQFTGKPRDQTLRIDAWPLSVAPLVPVDVSPRNGLGELRPDVEPPLVDTAPMRTRLVAEALVAALLLLYLAHVYVGLPWWTRRHRPFGVAWRTLRKAGSDASPAARRGAFERVHAAINRTAGEVLFESGLDRFVAVHPRFKGLRGDFGEFFARSRHEFFSPASVTPQGGADDMAWLAAFCRRCRDAERGAA
jgi:mxaA protein